MKINDVFDYFTSKAYSVATLSRHFHFYQLKVPIQLTEKLPIFSKRSTVWVLLNVAAE